MRKFICVLLSLILVSGNLFSQNHDDLLKYLDCDNIYPDPDNSGDTALVLYDKSPLGNHAGYYKGKKSNYILVEGKAGSALEFDSTGIAISTNKTLAGELGHTYYYDSLMNDIPKEKLTIAAWVKCNKVIAPGYQHIIGWGSGSGINIFIKDGKLQVETEYLPDDDMWGFLADNTTLNLKTKWTYGTEWTHIAAVFNQGILQLVINGNLIASDTVWGYKDNTDFTNSTLTVVTALKSVDHEGWSLGASFGWKPYDRGLTSGYNTFANYFNGAVDEVRIYSSALDTNQIRLLPDVSRILLRSYEFENILPEDSLLIEDTSPYNYNLVLFNGDKSSYSLVDGKLGKAMSFDGTLNAMALTIPNNYDYDNENLYEPLLNDMQHQELTISLWIKVSQAIAPGFQHIIGWGSGSGINMYIRNASLYVDIQNHAREDVWGFGGTSTLTSVKKKWTYGTDWNHVGVVFDHGIYKLLINGSTVAIDTVFGYLTAADYANKILTVIPSLSSIDRQGWSVGGAFGWKPYDHEAGQELTAWNKFACFFKGAIDELRIYNYALDSTEFCGLPGSPCPITGTSKLKVENSIVSIYPIPASDVLNLRLSNFKGNTVASVYNQLGALVKSYALKDVNTVLNLSGYSDGMYFLRLNNDGLITTHKFVVKK